MGGIEDKLASMGVEIPKPVSPKGMSPTQFISIEFCIIVMVQIVAFREACI